MNLLCFLFYSLNNFLHFKLKRLARILFVLKTTQLRGFKSLYFTIKRSKFLAKGLMLRTEHCAHFAVNCMRFMWKTYFEILYSDLCKSWFWINPEILPGDQYISNMYPSIFHLPKILAEFSVFSNVSWNFFFLVSNLKKSDLWDVHCRREPRQNPSPGGPRYYHYQLPRILYLILPMII